MSDISALRVKISSRRAGPQPIPKGVREGLESAYLTLAVNAGLDFVLGNPEKKLHLLAADDRFVRLVAEALESGRPTNGETQEEAGFRQAAGIIGLFDDHEND